MFPSALSASEHQGSAQTSEDTFFYAQDTPDRLEARAEREFDLAALSSGDIMMAHLLTVRR